jgi:hypothetical protein
MSLPKPVGFGILAGLSIAGAIAVAVSFQRWTQDREDERLLAHGEELAGQFCVACHLEPAPDILPKRSWEAALGYMGYWLGMENLDYLADHPEYAQANVSSRHEVLERENALPDGAALEESDWDALRHYYIDSAPAEALPQADKPELRWQLPQFEVAQADYPIPVAVTTLVRIRESTGEIYVGDGVAQTLTVLDGDGRVTAGPARASRPLSPVDIEFVEDTIYVGSIGDLLAEEPSEARPAYIATIELADQSIAAAEFEVIVDNLFRMADMNVLDLNGDGQSDFIVSGFGAVVGNVSWYESQPDGSFEEHVLVALPGAVKTEPYDFNDDGLLDIMVLLSDAREGLHILENQGGNEFELHTIFVTHPAYGHTYFELQDFNDDGAMDVLVVNGDNVDSDPYNTNKNYHGLRIYLNRGDYRFEEAFFYPLYGAFIAKSADFDEDGDLDIVANAFYPDFSSGARESFTYLENRGGLDFAAFTNGQVMRGRWMTMDIGDVDGDDDIDVVLGGGYIPIGMLAHIDLFNELAETGPPILILKNTLR